MKKTLISFLEFIRWKNLVIIIFTQCFTRYFLVKNNPAFDFINFPTYKLPYIMLATILIAAGGYVINDYFDIKIDLINKPKEVYIGRIISRRKALLLHQVLSFSGITLGAYLGLKIFLLNVLSVTLLWFYASVFKKKAFTGNLIVAFLTALSICEIAIFYDSNVKIIYAYAIFAFFITLIREIIKDVEDMAGDKSYGAQTIPISFGIRQTKKLIYIITTFFIFIVFYVCSRIDNTNLWAIFGLLGISIVVFVFKLYKADRKSQFGHLSRLCKYIMVLGILSMTVL